MLTMRDNTVVVWIVEWMGILVRVLFVKYVVRRREVAQVFLYDDDCMGFRVGIRPGAAGHCHAPTVLPASHPPCALAPSDCSLVPRVG